MSYRSITIDGTRHEYVIGQEFVKFRGGDAIRIALIGFPILGTVNHMVTPASIREYLTTGKIAPERLCDGHELHGCDQMVTGLVLGPPWSPKAGKPGFVFRCDSCLARQGLTVEEAV